MTRRERQPLDRTHIEPLLAMHVAPGEMIIGFFRGRFFRRQRFVEGLVERLGHDACTFLQRW